MSQSVLERTEIPVTQTTSGPPKFSHIVVPKSILTDAIINGTAVEALCGHSFVPGRDPRKYPVCTKCVEIFEAARGEEFGDRGEFE